MADNSNGLAVASSTFDVEDGLGLDDTREGPLYTADEPYDDLGGNGEFDEDDDFGVEIDPDHPALARVQAALKRQIMTQKQRLEEEIRLKKQQLKDTQRQREDTGVALYSAQQILAQQQMKLENTDDARAEIISRRNAANDRLDEAKGLHERMQSRSETIDSQVRDARHELQKLNDQSKKLRDNTEEVESGLKMAVRQADKALTVEHEAEIAKQQQDLYVDRLSEQVRQTEDRIKILGTKVDAQRDLTQESLKRLNEAQSELDQLKVERREVQQQWQSSLIALTKRSEMKHAMLDACDEQQQAIFSMRNELAAVKKQQGQVQEAAELSELRKRRIEQDKAKLQRTVAELNRRIDGAKSDYSVFTSTLKDTEKKLQVATRNYHLQVSKDNEMRTRLERAGQRKANLQKQLMAATYNAATLSKAGQNTLKTIRAEQKVNAEAEMRLHQEEHKLAREEVKVQNVESDMAAVQAERDATSTHLTEKEHVLDDLEDESRKNQRAIDRKESTILLLQRKIDTIMERRAKEGAGRAEVSPLELERDGIREEITAIAADNSQSQQKWLQRQHEFVLLTKEMATNSEELEDLRTRHAVLLRKKLRLTREVESNELELRRAKNKYSLMQNDIVKLNSLINKNAKAANSLESDTELMEVDFLRLLKDEELESIKLQETIEEIREDRGRLDQEVIDSEREILLWEKKIQLAEEMKATLKGDDESGSELAAMKAEIHRMELRSAQLARQKEVLIQEMERSVERRGEIQLQASASLKNKNNATVSKLKKQVVDLRKRVKQTQKDAASAEADTTAAVHDIEDLRQACEDSRRELQECLDAAQDAKREVARMRRQRNVNLDAITREQQMYRHLSNARAKAKVFKKSSSEYDAAIQQQINLLQSLNNVAEYVVQSNPEYGPLFDPVTEDISTRLAQVK